MPNFKRQEWKKVEELEQMEMLTEDKEKLVFENEKLEKQLIKL